MDDADAEAAICCKAVTPACEADQHRTRSSVLHSRFSQTERAAQLIAASPGSIHRNRTLGPGAVVDLLVPLPSLDAQREFAWLLDKAAQACSARRQATDEVDKLLPAMLHQALDEGRSTVFPPDQPKMA